MNQQMFMIVLEVLRRKLERSGCAEESAAVADTLEWFSRAIHEDAADRLLSVWAEIAEQEMSV